MPREIDEAWIEEAIERYRGLDTLRADYDRAVAAHVVSVHSPDDSIEVLVTAAGEIKDVRIRGSLAHRTAGELGREVLAVVTDAAEAARWAREKLYGEVFGAYGRLGQR